MLSALIYVALFCFVFFFNSYNFIWMEIVVKFWFYCKKKETHSELN